MKRGSVCKRERHKNEGLWSGNDAHERNAQEDTFYLYGDQLKEEGKRERERGQKFKAAQS
jgi:hypothetical protein